jgi:hypothetical protein
MEFPQLSAYDPTVTGGGSLDPLGLYLIADRLASKLAPGVRERMSNPRYLTAMALGAHVCNPFYSEYSQDGISPAYQVYEWHIVEGYVSGFWRTDPDQIQGLPGIQKATESFRNRLPLRPNRYLKAPSAFGFHGVYRTLSTDLKVLSEDYILQESGHELLLAWQKEQKLNGVYTGTGPWTNKASLFRNGIRESMQNNQVSRAWDWGIHESFAAHLRPGMVGEQEAKIILDALLADAHPHRKQMLEFLISEDGQESWRPFKSEKGFMKTLKEIADKDFIELIQVIENYERFSRCFQDAFDCCLHKMSSSVKTSHKELAEMEGVKRACAEMPVLFSEIETGLEKEGMNHEFMKVFGAFQQKMSPNDWVMTMWEHHSKVQGAKGKIGKRNWFERLEDGRFMIYPDNFIHKPIELSNEFIHGYRAQPLWSFLVNLKVVENG